MEFCQVPNKLKVLFLGSGPIAAPVLEALAAADNITLSAVVTQPDRPSGRTRIPTPTYPNAPPTKSRAKLIKPTAFYNVSTTIRAIFSARRTEK